MRMAVSPLPESPEYLTLTVSPALKLASVATVPEVPETVYIRVAPLTLRVSDGPPESCTTSTPALASTDWMTALTGSVLGGWVVGGWVVGGALWGGSVFGASPGSTLPGLPGLV